MYARQLSNRTELQWVEINKHVKDALVLMDDAAAECLHWHGGLKKILDGGAISVESFSPFVVRINSILIADSKVRKAVFIIMSPLTGENWRTLIVIIRANKFKHCVIITPLPAKLHGGITDETEQSFIGIENYLLRWTDNVNFTANVCHIPLFTYHVSQNVFVMPSFTQRFSLSECGLLEMNRKRTEELSLKLLNPEMESSIKILAYFLNSLLDTFQVKGDFYSLGPLSYLLASELESISQQQKKKSTYSNKASLIVVDRILDLAGPLSQSYDTMLDKVLLSLPHIPGHVFDICVNMEDLSACKSAMVFGRPLLAPGCIAHKSDSYAEVCLNAILYKNPREALIEMNRQIVECAGKEGINVDASSRLTSDILKKKVICFKENPKVMAKFTGLLQQTLAVIQALEFSSSKGVDNLAAIEKALLQYLTTSSEEVLSNIMQMITEKEEMNYKMEEIIIFLAFFYMLSGETDLANESAMQATLMETFFQDESMVDLLSVFVDEDEKDDENVLNSVRTLFNIFKRLGTIRRRLTRYKTLFKSTNPAFPASYNPLLKQILEDIFDPNLPENPDLEFHSAGLTNYIKTGFSLFMNVNKPQPRDNPVIFIIVLGGVTPSEIKIVNEYTSRHKETEIFLGCTEVLSPSNVLKDIGMIVKNLSKDASENQHST
nr:sec1 family domain-containing protein 2 isoform X3 [Parasteatoda tepidariorum]